MHLENLNEIDTFGLGAFGKGNVFVLVSYPADQKHSKKIKASKIFDKIE